MTLQRNAQIPETESKERLRLWLGLLKASRSIEATLRENLRTEFGSTLPRFDVMSALSRFKDGLKMSQISELLRVSNGNITWIVDRLAEDGCVVRIPVSGDRRAFLVQLTPHGKEEFSIQAKAHEIWIDEMLSGLDVVESIEIRSKLGQLGNTPKETKDEPSH
jgi:DNA-binding MarR family transcriptional regulator